MKRITIDLPNFPTQVPTLSFGDPSKPLILALHGWLDNAASFIALAPFLNNYHIIAIDLPGHGLFAHDQFHERYQVDNYLKLIVAVMGYLSDKPLILMGHSLGGAIASVIAARHPEKISKLILLDVLGPLSADMYANNPNLQTNAQLMRDAARYASSKVYDSFSSLVKVRMKANHLNAEQAQPLVERGSKQTQNGWQWSFDPRITQSSSFYYAEKEVLHLLKQIQCPVLVIAGEEGIFKGRAYYQARLKNITKLSFKTLKGSHHVHIQYPEIVASSIITFLQ